MFTQFLFSLSWSDTSSCIPQVQTEETHFCLWAYDVNTVSVVIRFFVHLFELARFEGKLNFHLSEVTQGFNQKNSPISAPDEMASMNK